MRQKSDNDEPPLEQGRVRMREEDTEVDRVAFRRAQVHGCGS
jgi:hypothetical protein